MTDYMTDKLPRAGQLLMGLFFLSAGVMKFINWSGYSGSMEKHNIILIPLLLAITGLVETLGGLALLINRYSKIASFLLAGLIGFITVFMHDYWNMSGGEANTQFALFYRNIAIVAGLMVLVGYERKSTSES